MPFPCAHPLDTYSQAGMVATAAAPPSSARIPADRERASDGCHPVDPAVLSQSQAEELALRMWPGFGRVRGTTHVLKPGEALFIPPYWSCHSETLAPPHGVVPASTNPVSSASSGSAASLSATRAKEHTCMTLVVWLHNESTDGCSGPLNVPSVEALTLQVCVTCVTWQSYPPFRCVSWQSYPPLPKCFIP